MLVVQTGPSKTKTNFILIWSYIRSTYFMPKFLAVSYEIMQHIISNIWIKVNLKYFPW